MKPQATLGFASLFASNLATPIRLTNALAVLLARSASLWTTLGCAVLLATVVTPARAAAVTEAWVHRYSNVVSNSAELLPAKVVRDATGDIIVAGTIDDHITGADMLTIKYSGADGRMLWQKRYDGPANNNDQANAVAVDGNGNVVVTGYSYGTNSYLDSYTAKYAAADGALLWEKRYNGPANNDDGSNAVTVDGNGNVVVTGYSSDSVGADYYTAKYAAADGALLWEKRYNGPAAGSSDQTQAVAVDGSGNVVVTGSSEYDYYTAKYAAADGVLLWEKRYNGANQDYAQALAVDGNGNVVVTGISYHNDSSDGADYYTAKYAVADGVLLWEKRYNGPTNRADRALAVAVDGNGNVVVTGYSAGSGTSDDYYTAKYAAADGELLWEKRSNGLARALALDGNGNVVVTGSSQNSGADYYTAKYAAANGALLWERRYNSPANDYDAAQAVAVDSSGNVVVTGVSYAGTNTDHYTAKYAAADGALLWEQRYNGPANGNDYAQAVAVDGSGNVVVTGYSSGSGGDYDCYTAKYAAADGALLWEKRSNGGGQAVALDGSGNAVVTGYSHNGTSNEYYTAKYAAADGVLLWEKRYNGPANKNDQANAVAVDGSGNVVVTGYSYGTNSYPDYYTAKYAAVDGALLWEKRYDGPANADDQAQAVVVDGSGNVVVTGTSRSGDDSGDYYTAKYAAADGALLWEKRYNGPANGSEYVASSRSLALGPNGMVAVTGSSDGNFGPGTTFDYATVVYRESVSLVTIELVPTGVRLRFAGDSGRTYTIERSLAVAGPWTPINTPTAPIGGLIEYVDTDPPLGTGFYRTSTP